MPLPRRHAGTDIKLAAAVFRDPPGTVAWPAYAGDRRPDAATLTALVPGAGWQRLSRADGSKGPRPYDWALVGMKSPQHHLLVRRSLAPNEKGVPELAFYRCWSPSPVALPELGVVAGARWGVEDCLAEAARASPELTRRV